MKKAERIDIGKQCVHKMIDENLSYRDLELIPFNGEIFSKDTLKKYMELYILPLFLFLCAVPLAISKIIRFFF